MSARDYCFTVFDMEYNFNNTINNQSNKIKYLVYQKELCPTSGKQHFQCYCEFENKIRFAAVKKIFGSNIHFENRFGTREQARNYCMKEESRIEGPWELGTFKPSEQGKRNDLLNMYDLIKDGADSEELVESNPVCYMRFYKAIQHVKTIFDKKKRNEIRTNLKVEVCYGPAGSGKTRRIIDNNDPNDIYELVLNNKSQTWWDGYEGEKILVINDFYGHSMAWDELLNILDIYPKRLPVKGGFTYANWDYVYITSNIHPKDWYPNKGYPKELSRRIHIITELKNNTIEEPKQNINEDIQNLLFDLELIENKVSEVNKTEPINIRTNTVPKVQGNTEPALGQQPNIKMLSKSEQWKNYENIFKESCDELKRLQITEKDENTKFIERLEKAIKIKPDRKEYQRLWIKNKREQAKRTTNEQTPNNTP